MAQGEGTQLQQKRVMNHGHVDHLRGLCDHFLADDVSFLMVAVQQLFTVVPALGECEFPGQVHGILHARIHALPTGRAVHMGRIPGQESASNAILRDEPFIDHELAEPGAACDLPILSGPFIQDVLNFLFRRISAPRARSAIEYDAPSLCPDGKEPQHGICAKIGVHEMRVLLLLDCYVCQEPAPLDRVSVKGKVQPMTHLGMRAIGPHDPSRGHRSGVSLRTADLRYNPVIVLCERDKLGLSLDVDALLRKLFDQKMLCRGLRYEHPGGQGAFGPVQFDLSERFLWCLENHPVHRRGIGVFEKLLNIYGGIQHLQRALPNDKRL